MDATVRLQRVNAHEHQLSESGQLLLWADPVPTKLCECGCGQPAAIAQSTDRSRGYVKGQPTRFARGHAAGRKFARPASPGNKFCLRCEAEKPVEDFPLAAERQDGRYPYCLPCKRQLMRDAVARWKTRHPEEYRRSQRKTNLRKKGMTLEEYEQLAAAQRGRCAICGTEPNGVVLAVDHCHATGQIRGLLCTPCNMGIGHLRDDPDVLRRAAAYLDHHRGRQYVDRDSETRPRDAGPGRRL